MTDSKVIKDWSAIIMYFIGAIGIILFVGLTFYQTLWGEPTQDIVKLEVTGVVDSVNATTVTSLHFECIKYCVYNLRGNNNMQTRCMEQCATLGEEVC